MPETTRLVFLRHGEVEEKYQRVFGGRIDMELSPLGHEQASRLAQHLTDTSLDALYVSPLKRAQQTIAPLLAVDGRRAATLSELQEVDFGDWTGLRWDEVADRFGASAFRWLEELERGSMAGAESVARFRSRVGRCLDRFVSKHSGQTVGVVCHGGVIRMFLALLLELPLPKTAGFEIDYASVSVVDHQPRGAEIQLLNLTPWRRLP